MRINYFLVTDFTYTCFIRAKFLPYCYDYSLFYYCLLHILCLCTIIVCSRLCGIFYFESVLLFSPFSFCHVFSWLPCLPRVKSRACVIISSPSGTTTQSASRVLNARQIVHARYVHHGLRTCGILSLVEKPTENGRRALWHVLPVLPTHPEHPPRPSRDVPRARRVGPDPTPTLWTRRKFRQALPPRGNRPRSRYRNLPVTTCPTRHSPAP